MFPLRTHNLRYHTSKIQYSRIRLRRGGASLRQSLLRFVSTVVKSCKFSPCDGLVKGEGSLLLSEKIMVLNDIFMIFMIYSVKTYKLILINEL